MVNLNNLLSNLIINALNLKNNLHFIDISVVSLNYDSI